MSSVNKWISIGIFLWYIQTHKIRIRLEVVAWAFSVVILLMFVFWLVIYFGWNQGDYIPPRSLYGLLTGKSPTYVPGAGNSNYLLPYFPTDESLPGFVRYVYFFPGPEALALVVSFVSLVALDLKHRLWSLLLLVVSIFLLLTSGTRSAMLVLPLVFSLRYLLTVGSAFGPWFLSGLIAIVSFTTLSLPPVTNVMLNTVTGTAEAAGSARADSTEIRGEIYKRTWESILNASDGTLLLGHVMTGETVLPGYAPAMVGSHSFLLGTLLYRSGLLGSTIFLTYWISL
ncbi:MAG: O-antigen ligase domain-containing protein, partial [Moorea sp. SIO4G2]|nr:O-antigen ligase domain-containing protein [Moorena sp. SIO4G2]